MSNSPTPTACTQATHAAATATLDLFRANMTNITEWFDSSEGVDMLQGDCPKCHSTLCWDFNADRPYLFWDPTLETYGYEDGPEQGICQHRSTTDALDLLGADKAPTLEQLHALGDDWAFRTISFRDKRGRLHTLHAESYRQPDCCHGSGMVLDGTLSDGRKRWLVCTSCSASADASKSPCLDALASMPERFRKKISINQETGCWEWTSQCTHNGYPMYWHEGSRTYAHRYSYETLIGSIGEGLQMDHLCRTRNCANPWHLEQVTQRENLLRGQTIVAANARKTHCDSGHEFTDSNTYVKKTGSRCCRECARITAQRRRDAAKECHAFEPYDGLNAESMGEIERIQNYSLSHVAGVVG